MLPDQFNVVKMTSELKRASTQNMYQARQLCSVVFREMISWWIIHDAFLNRLE